MTDPRAGAVVPGGPAGAGASELVPLRRFLRRVRRRSWLASAAVGALRLAAVGAAAAVLNTLVAERAGAPPWVAFALGLLGALAFWVGLGRFLLGALRIPSLADTARLVDREVPGLRDDLESSLELAPLLGRRGRPGEVSRPLVRALIGETRERLAPVRPGRFVRRGDLGRALLVCAACAVPLAALALLPPGLSAPPLRAVLDPRVYWPLGRLVLAVEPGAARVARGGELAVRVRPQGARPAGVLVHFRGPGPEEGMASMTWDADGAWTHRFAPVVGGFRYRAEADGAASAWFDVEVAEPPVAGNFEALYTYPAYTGLAPRRVPGSGDLEALRGTAVQLTFAANKDLRRAFLVAGQSRFEARPAGARLHRVAFPLSGETSYRLELEDTEGFRNAAAQEYAIRYVADAVPAAEILAPTGVVETELRAPLTVRYRAGDDFGLSRLSLVARTLKGEQRTPLGLPAGAKHAEGEYAWDVGGIDAEPGEAVTAWLEAVDNDTITGPKTGVSATLTLRVADPRAKREEFAEAMRLLTDDLVNLLGEELELQERYRELEEAARAEWERFPWDSLEAAARRQHAARDAAAKAAERAEALAEEMAASPEGREETQYQMDLLRRGLQELREGRLEPMREMTESLASGESPQEEVGEKAGHLSRYAEDAARRAEELALMAEQMQRERRMDEVREDGDALARLEENLLREMDRLEQGDRAAMEEILKGLEEMQRQLEELARALARDNKELPEEFLNSDALKDLNVIDVAQDLERIRDLLRKGDLAGARKALQDLARKLEDLRRRLRQAGDEFEDKIGRALDRLQGSTVPELARLAEEQRALLGTTEGMARQVAPRLEQALRQFAAGALPERGRTSPPSEAELLTPEERARAQGLAQAQEGLRGRTERLATELAALKAVLPFLPDEIGRSLERAGGSMGEARGALGGSAPGEAVAPERAALAELMRARDQAQQSLAELGEMQGLRQGGGRPMMGGGRLPGMSSSPTRGRRSGGRLGLDVRNFAIPGREDYQVPRMFREEVLKSLREGYPPQYEERIKDYYHRIAE